MNKWKYKRDDTGRHPDIKMNIDKAFVGIWMRVGGIAMIKVSAESEYRNNIIGNRFCQKVGRGTTEGEFING